MNDHWVCRVASAFGTLLLCAAASTAETGAPPVTITGGPTGGAVEIGQTIEWIIQRKPGDDTQLHYRLREGLTKVIAHGDLPPGQTSLPLSASIDHPGWLYLEVTGEDGAHKAIAAGVVVAPDKMKAAAQRPADFDSFWKAEIAKVASVPPNAVETTVDSEKSGVKLSQITLDNVDGAHAHAQLARPERGDRFPAVILFQYAGLYPLQKAWATDLASQGWLVLNVSAHDLPIDQPKSFYDQLGRDKLRNYASIGATSRETSYFRHLLLGDYQAVEYLARRPDWDGQTLVVHGDSQGGLQSVAMAMLDAKVTDLIVAVPAGGDTQSMHAGRAPGWPYWAHMEPADQRDQIMETSRYYDTVNFAAGVRVPAFVAVGLCDSTATPTSVLAAFNALGGPRELLIMPDATHQHGHDRATQRVAQWFESLRTTGKPPAGTAP